MSVYSMRREHECADKAKDLAKFIESVDDFDIKSKLIPILEDLQVNSGGLYSQEELYSVLKSCVR